MPPLRVLSADDHPLIRSGLRALLEREGEFQVVGEASDGYEAIELATHLKPAVAMLDVGMPRLNGIDAGATYIRADCGRPYHSGQHAFR
jgi:DNA-binding NarL/FixJ family response regulator